MNNENKLQNQEEILKQQEAEIIEGGANDVNSSDIPTD